MKLPVFSLLVGAGLLSLVGCDRGPVQFVSYARLVDASTVQPDQGEGKDRAERLATVMELVLSDEVRYRALERIEATHPDLFAVSVDLDVTRTRGSGILNLQVVGSEPDYTQVYLDAALDEFIYVLGEVSEGTADTEFKKATEELMELEGELVARENTMKAFRKDHPVDTEVNQAQLKAIKTDLDHTKTLYENLLKRVRELDLTKNQEKPAVSIMERATVAIELKPKGIFEW